ncbi:hypothetical protein M197_gp86 [Haloarcula hispanica tailed virus 2]|uniref:Uncharacterized protein n=1 Tax=Haloarcula hispanica tailed virus 2 TaxID=1273751 RepID=R4T8M8_9CAUD|nr:hypothetical protein M197_gp86 [Haloarcula hispanica tailed virus 2]AGM11250.1 hypothetical protein HHTV2_86 [Haloarcula hispanica tailed virus 2]
MNLLDEIPEDERSEAHQRAADLAEQHDADDYAFHAQGGYLTVHLLFEQETEDAEAGATSGIHPETGEDDDETE